MTNGSERDRHDDPWIEAALEERIGGRVPPDLAASLLDASHRSDAHDARRISVRAAAAAIVVLGLAVVFGVRALRPDGVDPDRLKVVHQDPKPERPVRVLLLDDAPRWEYRYLRNVLLRASEQVAVQAFLFSAESTFVQEHSAGLDPLREAPRTAADLANYDVILIGDVPPGRFGRDRDERNAFYAELRAFVAHGGGLGVIAGAGAMPHEFRETPFAALLPTELPEDSRTTDRVTIEDRQFSQDRALHAITRVLGMGRSDLPIASGSTVEVTRFALLGAVREGASAILTPARADDVRPLAAVGTIEDGRTLIVAISSIELRTRYGAEEYDRFWTRAVNWLARRDR